MEPFEFVEIAVKLFELPEIKLFAVKIVDCGEGEFWFPLSESGLFVISETGGTRYDP